MPILPNPDYLNHAKMKAAAEQVDDAARIAALQQFLPAFQKSFTDWTEAGRPDFEARIGRGDEALRQLQQDGVSALRIEPKLKAEVLRQLGPDLDMLDQRLAGMDKPKFRDMNMALEKPRHQGVYDLVQAAFEDLDIFEMGRAYMRRPMRIKKLFVQLNNARETSARYGAIDEAGLPPLKTDYWHIDSDIWPSIKVLIYLNEVELDQGPLRYVAGSHRELPSFETVVRKTNDTLKLPTVQFVALPEELRMHALFGPYLTGAEPQVPDLLDRERAVCGGGADLVLFDNNGVHRGGFVRSGARKIIQCLFEAVP
jgi:hypothetical protein